MRNFFNNLISYRQLLDSLTQLKIGDQYCLKTQKACDRLRITNTYNLEDKALRNLINDSAMESTKVASEHAKAINKVKDNEKKFSDLLIEYGKKRLF